MKNSITYLLLFFGLFINTAFCQSFQWAKSIGGTANDGTSFLALDPSGNIYTGTSCMYPTTYFNSDTFAIDGFNDIFLSKYDNNGNKIWIKQFGGPNGNMVNIKQDGFGGIIYDGFSNTIISAGTFIESSNFGCTTLSTLVEDRQIFLTKTDLNGNCLWSKQAGGTLDDFGYSVTSDINGNIFLVGSVLDSAYFDTIHVARGGILAKYDINGNCLWAKNIISYTNTLGNMGSSIKIGEIRIDNNELYLIGSNVEDTLTIDNSVLQQSNYYGKVIAKFDLNGNLIWYKQLAGPSSFGISALSTDALSNIYVTGSFSNGIAIFENDTITSSGSTDMFFAKYDTNGNKIWVTNPNASQNSYGIDISSDLDGNIYLTGAFKGLANFGSFVVNSNTNLDMFIARYNNNGVCLGISQSDNSEGDAIGTDGGGAAIVGGSYIGSTNFGMVNLTSFGNTDAFIAKHSAITGQGGNERIINNQLTIYTNPNKGSFRIKLPDEITNMQNAILLVFDQQGREVARFNLEEASESPRFDVNKTSAGLYTVQLVQGKKTYWGKMVVE